MDKLTLGSLFDGSGGFPLGGLISGITPVWASEIEPFPIRVTTKRLPFIKHYGDISTMDGSKIEPVDIIAFGSPCQDLSIAGKRDGLDGKRSSLFYEAIRIVKEMRCATDGKKPRYIVWENVPGAFSSNKGEDFRCVLEGICHIKDETLSVPKIDKWKQAGTIVGDHFSLAWRVLDAQYWGVPQRRKRIFLVADFAGGGAGEILFKSEGLSGYSPQGFRSWQTAPGDSANRPGTTGIGFDGYNGSVTDDKSATLGVNCGMSTGRNGVVLNDQGGNRMDVTEDVTYTLRAEAHHPPCVLEEAVAVENHPMDGRVKLEENGKVQTLSERMGTGGNNQPFVVETPKTLKIRSGCEGGGKGARPSHKGCGYTDYKDPPTVSEEPYYIVRRLTPTECARLQGFPDWWCDDLGTDEPTDEDVAFWREVFETHRKVVGTSSKPKTDAQIIKWLKNPHADSAEYKLWGNGVALPCVHFVLAGIVWFTQLEVKS